MSRESLVLKIVEEALDIEDEAARAALLAERCGADAILRARVDRLLARNASDLRLLPTGSFIRPLGVIENIPERIGPWRIIGEIARGGMGAVVRAERIDGMFQQQVAIKLIRGDVASDRARARFAEERRILARLRHPAIVRILDGGDADGRPWLAMDFIDGQPIDEALRAIGATRDARLDAFEAICAAVAHAHRGMVIHADIKPSNVLMSADGQVHLLDFGIARLISAIDVDETGDPYPLTKGYAAPERGVGLLPTIASDVFSMGVLLLAIFDLPLPVEGIACMPGTRLPQGVLAGDLGAIAACALAERPEDRYPDVPAMLDDIRRHRDWLPVRARGDADWRYRAGRFVRRHCRPLLFAAAFAGVLTATSAVSTVQFWRAEQARSQANARFMELRGLARFMLFEHYDHLADAPGTVAARAELAAVAGRYLDRLRQAPGAPVDLRLDAARGYRRLATIEGLSGSANLGRPDLAARSLDRAEAILLPLARQVPRNPGVAIELGWVALSRWTLAADSGGPALVDRAQIQFDRAIALEPGNTEALLGAINTDRARAFDLEMADRHAESQALARQALARLRAIRFPPRLKAEVQTTAFALLNRIGDAIYYGGDISGSLVPYGEAEQLVLGELARGPSVRWEEKLGEARFNISGTLGALTGRESEALAIAEEGIGRLRRVLATGSDAALELRLLVLLGEKANLLQALGRPADAARVSREGIALREARLAAQPGDFARQRDLIVALAAHADALLGAGQSAEACKAARSGIERLAKLDSSGGLSQRDRRTEGPKLETSRARACPAR